VANAGKIKSVPSQKLDAGDGKDADMAVKEEIFEKLSRGEGLSPEEMFPFFFLLTNQGSGGPISLDPMSMMLGYMAAKPGWAGSGYGGFSEMMLPMMALLTQGASQNVAGTTTTQTPNTAIAALMMMMMSHKQRVSDFEKIIKS